MTFTENDCFFRHPLFYDDSEVIAMDERVILRDLPTDVRGFVYQDDTGEPVIVVNSRLTREANRRTFDHERGHIARGEMNEQTYIEYGGD